MNIHSPAIDQELSKRPMQALHNHTPSVLTNAAPNFFLTVSLTRCYTPAAIPTPFLAPVARPTALKRRVHSTRVG